MKSEETVRQISNLGNIIALVVAGICLVLTVIVVVFSTIKEWQIMGLIGFLLLIPALMVSLILSAKVISVKRINKAMYRLPYRFDYEKEYTTYRIIGKEKYKLKNGAVYFERYSLWKEHVESNFNSFINIEDYYRFLNQIYRRKIEFREVLGIILVPVIAGCITGILSMDSVIEKVISSIFWILFLSIYFSRERVKATNEVNFLGDYIEIVTSETKQN